MQYLLITVLLLVTAVVIAVVVMQGKQTVDSDTTDLAERYAQDAETWQARSMLPPLLTRVYISEGMRDSDAQRLSALGYTVSGRREIAWPRSPRLWVVTWSKT